MGTPKVSVIVPVYNVEEFLEQCLESILNQSLQEIEVIVLNDGSTDGSAAIVDAFAAKDSRVRVVHKANEGYGATCNKGLDLATGEYVGIVESDDFIHEDMYRDLYAYALKLGAEVVKGPFFEHYPEKLEFVETIDGYTKGYVFNGYLSEVMPEQTLYSLHTCPCQLATHQSIWAGIYKRDYLDVNQIRFLEVPGAGHVDIGFCVESLRYSEKLAWLNTPYYYYRIEREGSSSDNLNMTENFTRYREMQDRVLEDPELFEACAPYLLTRETIGAYTHFARAHYEARDVALVRGLFQDFTEEQISAAPLLDDSLRASVLACRESDELAIGEIKKMRHETPLTFIAYIIRRVEDRGWLRIAIASFIAGMVAAFFATNYSSSIGTVAFAICALVFIVSFGIVVAFPVRRFVLSLRER